MSADRHAWLGGERHEGEQARAVGHLQRQAGRAEIETALADPHAGRRGAQHLDQLVVGVRDRPDSFPPAVRIADPHDVTAVGVDVLDLGVVQQPLEPVQAEQRVEGRPGQVVLLVARHDRGPDGEGLPGAALQRLSDQLSPERLLVTSPESRPAAIVQGTLLL